MLVDGIEAAGYTPGDDVAIAMDPATSESGAATAPTTSHHEGRVLSAAELAAYWVELAGRYPIVSIEDGMAEEDWDGWKALTDALGDQRAARRRRPVRHQHRAPAARHRRRRRPTRSSSRSTRSAR